jgi:hypothetical protein
MQPLPKPKVFIHILEKGIAQVIFDATAAGVVVPSFVKSRKQARLDFGLNMAVQIPDLYVDEETGISGTLSFNRTPFRCVIPWPAVYAIVGEDNRGMTWPADNPVYSNTEPERTKARGTLKVVK